MKNTNENTDYIIRKLNINSTKLVTSLVALMATSTMVQANELIKAEPIKQINLYQEAKASLALSFSDLTITQNNKNAVATSMMAKKKHSVNSPITLTKVNLFSK